jgi:hypothetical protein
MREKEVEGGREGGRGRWEAEGARGIRSGREREEERDRESDRERGSERERDGDLFYMLLIFIAFSNFMKS